jgi:AraC family transcriptional regulator, transcriptional activator of pobA
VQIDADFNRFLQLVDAHFREQHSVQFYLNELNVSEKKLGALTKQHLGASPLQAIHQRLVLEIKRLLLFGEESHKEIAYSLGFDSPASFSAFVKKKTGMTPSELQTSVAEIQK